MKFRRILTPAVLIVTLLVQFLPGTIFAPQPVAAAACDAAQFMADVTIPDGTSYPPGAALSKTWQFKNIGTCTWSTSYAIVFYAGSKMGAPSVVYMPYSVAPGATVNVTVNMTAPTASGQYRGYWMLRNASNVLFGVGPYGTYWFFIDIVVTGGGSSPASAYDFVARCSDATWTSGAGSINCNVGDGSSSGYVLTSPAPQLEDGSLATMPGLIVAPNYVTDGYISGTYPSIMVQSGDRFQSIVSCQYGVTSCYVTFRLDYQIDGGLVYNLWTFREKTEGLYYRANVDLSGLAGHNVKFTLKVLASGSPAGDRVVWGGARLVHAGGVVPPVPTTTTTITADSPDPSTPGQTVPVSVTVTGSGATPTGTVAITGADTNCTLTLSGGSGSCNVVFNTTGAKTLTATYSGDGYYPGSSDTESHTVSTATSTSTTTITNDAPDPSIPGQSVPVSVTVSGSGTSPTGVVAITGADTNCTITLSGGSGSCNVVFNSTGAKTLTATYSGDGYYTGSSDTESHTVSLVPAATTNITADTPDPSIPGQLVAVSVTVIGSGTTPTGTVAITGADTNCSLTLAGGSGSCNVVFNTTGSKTLTATYSGNVNYAGSSDTETHTVSTGMAATATTITSDIPDPSIPGQAVVVSVTVSGAGLPAPTGTVAVTGADTNCTILLAGGSGSCSAVFNTTGAKTITAAYSGDGNYAPSSSTTSHTVIKGSTTTTITTDTPDPSIPTQAVAVSVNVIGAGVTPNGTVEITGADINCTLTLSGGSGTCNVVFNTIGSKTITATYSGDGNYLSSLGTEGHTVKNVTTTTITSDNPDPSTPGDPTLGVWVKVSGAGIAPVGTVEITGADVNCTITLVLADNGIGVCPVVFNTAGAKILTATYGGDVNYAGSSGTASHTVIKGSTTTTIFSDLPEPSLTFQSVEVSVLVAGGGVDPSGSVAITISGVSSTCNATLVGAGGGASTGSCSVVFNAIGTYTITATYSGDGNYLGGVDTESHTVN